MNCVQLIFSPTGGTEKIVRTVAGALAGHLGLEPKYINFTKPENRQTEYRFGPEDLLVMASPVYAGRLPNKLMPEYKAKIFGGGTPANPHLRLWQPESRRGSAGAGPAAGGQRLQNCRGGRFCGTARLLR